MRAIDMANSSACMPLNVLMAWEIAVAPGPSRHRVVAELTSSMGADQALGPRREPSEARLSEAANGETGGKVVRSPSETSRETCDSSLQRPPKGERPPKGGRRPSGELAANASSPLRSSSTP